MQPFHVCPPASVFAFAGRAACGACGNSSSVAPHVPVPSCCCGASAAPILFQCDIRAPVPIVALSSHTATKRSFVEIAVDNFDAFEAAQLFLCTRGTHFAAVRAINADGLRFYARVSDPLPLGPIQGIAFTFTCPTHSAKIKRHYVMQAISRVRAITIHGGTAVPVGPTTLAITFAARVSVIHAIKWCIDYNAGDISCITAGRPTTPDNSR